MNYRNLRSLELARGGLRMSRRLFALYVATAFAGGVWVSTWITAFLTR